MTEQQRLEGDWLRDARASDQCSFCKALDLMRLSRFEKFLARRLIQGLQIEQSDEGEVKLHFLTKVVQLIILVQCQLTEEFSRERETVMGRRDFRDGRQKGRLGSLSSDRMELALSWDGVMPGRIQEEFATNGHGKLEVRSTLEVAGCSTRVVQVYNRAA